jgi:hypothetical protein
MITPEKAAAKLIRNAGNAGQDWLDGVTNPARDPVQAALKAKEKYKNNLKMSLDKDTWAKKMAKVSSADIIAIAMKIGPAGYTNGIAAREGKILAAMQRIIPKIAAVQASVLAMPDATEVDRDKRMLENVKQMRAIKGT